MNRGFQHRQLVDQQPPSTSSSCDPGALVGAVDPAIELDEAVMFGGCPTQTRQSMHYASGVVVLYNCTGANQMAPCGKDLYPNLGDLESV
ncbi:MAG: hypothetical protein Q9169_004739 [Polycauliona sp. 2 TL-2023]